MLSLSCEMLEESPVDGELSKRVWLRVLTGGRGRLTVHECMRVLAARAHDEQPVPLEHLLPLLDEFTAVSDLKELVCTELQGAGQLANDLRRTLDAGVKRSAVLLNEIGALRDDMPDEGLDEPAPCMKCGRRVFGIKGVRFPCGHAWHASCLDEAQGTATCLLCARAFDIVDVGF